jgi:hypothetical protein
VKESREIKLVGDPARLPAVRKSGEVAGVQGSGEGRGGKGHEVAAMACRERI